MIDLNCTRTQLLAEIGAPNPVGPPLGDLMDARVLLPDAHVVVQGHTRDDLFPLLEVVLSESFAAAPREQLIRDLFVPLKNALGNAYKHGNGRDPAKSITVEIVLTAKGALLAITAEGPGFDVGLVLQNARGELPPGNRGAGLRNLERSNSVITYEKGWSHSALALPADAKRGTFRDVPHAATGRQEASDREEAFSEESAFRLVLDDQWTRSCLSEEMPEFRQGESQLGSCRVYAKRGFDAESYAFRVVLRSRGPDHDETTPRIFTGRWHANESLAYQDFGNSTKLRGELRAKQLRIPRATRLAREPRLVIHEFAPWMNLWEYLADRGNPHVLQSTAERVGKALAELHQSQIAFSKFDSETVGERLQTLCARVTTHLDALRANTDLFRCAEVLVQRLQKRAAAEEPTLHQRRLVPIHGALGWDCIYYGVDGRFYLQRFEACRPSYPELDLGAFLADLWLFSEGQRSREAYDMGMEALAEGYGSKSSRSSAVGNPHVALALLERMDRVLRRPGVSLSHLAVSIGLWERFPEQG
jgi:anti-sigma regulatory factor (Ser/Thr protein kinase)